MSDTKLPGLNFLFNNSKLIFTLLLLSKNINLLGFSFKLYKLFLNILFLYLLISSDSIDSLIILSTKG